MIRFSCKCGKQVSVDEKYAGKRGKCPLCGEIVIIPLSDSSELRGEPISNSGTKIPHNPEPKENAEKKASAQKEVKDCPYCGEEILEVAKKCKHCGEFLLKETTNTDSQVSRENLLPSPTPSPTPNPTPNPIANVEKHFFTYAGLWLRFAAFFVDFCIFLAIGAMIGAIVGALFASAEKPESGGLTVIVLICLVSIPIVWLYNALFLSSKMQGTPGKMLLGIKVTDLAGNRISFGRATGRYLLEYGWSYLLSLFIDFKGHPAYALIILLAYYLVLVFNEKKQCLHDMIAGCLVIKR